MQKRNRPAVRIKSPEKRARIGERIKVAATGSGLTLKDLALAIGIGPSLIYQYVRGITNIPPETLAAICARTNVSPEFFDPDRGTRNALVAGPDNAPEQHAMQEGHRISLELARLDRLAGAYGTPRRDLPGLIPVLHEMLALARVSGDSEAEANLSLRVGLAEMEAGDLDRARASLAHARDLHAAAALEEGRLSTLLALAQCAEEAGDASAAASYAQEAAEVPAPGGAWRASLRIAGIQARASRHAEALKSLIEASASIGDPRVDPRADSVVAGAVPVLADLAVGTGHFEPGLDLWETALEGAAETHEPNAYVAAMIRVAECYGVLGRLRPALERAGCAASLADLVLCDAPLQAQAWACLAWIQVEAGMAARARESARRASRPSARSSSSQALPAGALAAATAAASLGEWEEARRLSEEAIAEAQTAAARVVLVRARMVRAQACRALAAREPDSPLLEEALQESGLAVETARRAGTVVDLAAAEMSLAECLIAAERPDDALAALDRAVDSLEHGALDLAAVLGEDSSDLPPLLRSPNLDVALAFTGRRVEAPAVEWRVRYLRGTLQAKRAGPRAGFEDMRKAAASLGRILDGLNTEESERYMGCHTVARKVFEALTAFAVTGPDKEVALAVVRAAGRGAEAPSPTGP